ncbi:MAG: hypothetical protein VZR36_12535 [Prevotella sp.]|nr:hypothetical protein [Prevotella sp.]
MYKIRRALVWLRRSRHSRGFGVQSPWAYRFIRYVINEHYPYYSYSDLKSKWKKRGKKELKMCRLYFRISNYLQSPFALDYSYSGDMFADYVTSGCKRTKIIIVHPESPMADIDAALSTVESIPFLRLVLQGDYRTMFEKSLRKADDKSLFVVEGINSSKDAKAFWKEIVSSERFTTTFDLYYCGIIFFDHKRYKENYIVNF